MFINISKSFYLLCLGSSEIQNIEQQVEHMAVTVSVETVWSQVRVLPELRKSYGKRKTLGLYRGLSFISNMDVKGVVSYLFISAQLMSMAFYLSFY